MQVKDSDIRLLNLYQCRHAIDTPLLRGSINDSPDPAGTEAFLGSKSVFGRMGTSEEVANVMYFLASDEASFVTGAAYFVDGGWSIM